MVTERMLDLSKLALLKAEAKRWPRARSGWTALRANLRLWWEQGWFPWHLS